VLETDREDNPTSSGSTSTSTSTSDSGDDDSGLPSSRLAVLEPATITLAAHFASGALSPAAAYHQAITTSSSSSSTVSSQSRRDRKSFGGEIFDLLQDRSSLHQSKMGNNNNGDDLAKVLEWSEWHRLFARAEVDNGEKAVEGEDEVNNEGSGPSRYWRWNGQHLVRYRVWSSSNKKNANKKEEEEEEAVAVSGAASKEKEGDEKTTKYLRFWRSNKEDEMIAASAFKSESSSGGDNEEERGEEEDKEEEEEGPILVMVHGFGASSDQWERLVKDMNNPCRHDALWTQNGLQVSFYGWLVGWLVGCFVCNNDGSNREPL
jgi:hypothetical protein